ncbi:hypothetical protein HGRIS_008700 [Hohenbuehelia grisea]|uniref:F-box domain-containing protein n=1 Tax=Hohenbuehelia grisea TaxID=104357 RepID=A0ABR3J9A1_9AGAR
MECLPTELVGEIAHHLSIFDISRLRLTCRTLSDKTHSQFFSEVKLDFSDLDAACLASKLEGLPVFASKASAHTKLLKIHGPHIQREQILIPLCAAVKYALNLLQNVTSFQWIMNLDIPVLEIIIIDYLMSLPSLESLALYCFTKTSTHFPINNFTRLRSLSLAHSSAVDLTEEFSPLAIHPRLERLSLLAESGHHAREGLFVLQAAACPAPPTQPFRLQTFEADGISVKLPCETLLLFRSLIRLHIPCWYTKPVDQLGGELWPILQREQMHLRSIVVPDVHDTLLAYLASYSGLEELIIHSAGAQNGSIIWMFSEIAFVF